MVQKQLSSKNKVFLKKKNLNHFYKIDFYGDTLQSSNIFFVHFRTISD